MYRQLQQKAKDYIIASLCAVFEEWKFDIDTSNDDNPAIVGYGPDGVEIRAPIEEFSNYFPKEVIKKITENCKTLFIDVDKWIGCAMIRLMVSHVFRIYKVDIIKSHGSSSNFVIRGKYCDKQITSNIHVNTNYNIGLPYCISPFYDSKFNKGIFEEQLVSPLLLLLDPVKYFRKYSIIIHKHPELDRTHTLGIYELLLEYFPEINRELIEKCWMIENIFWDLATDIGGLVIEVFINSL